MNKYSHFDFVLKFFKESNTKTFWDELNQIIKSYNVYHMKLNIDQRIKLASETRISSIKDKNYISFNDLRNGIILFPYDTTENVSDLELLILILRSCNMVFSYKLPREYAKYKFDENIKYNKEDKMKETEAKEEVKKEVKKEVKEEVKEEKKFIKFINIIDEYINNFDYDKIFTKPDFFLEFNDPNIQAYIHKKPPPELMHFSQNTNITKLNKDRDILEDKKQSANVMDDFTQKKKFYDLNTEFISRDKIFVDSKQDLIFKYQYMINNFFNKCINEYIKKNNLESDDILFIYKGGTFMKILFQKYNDILKSNDQFMKMNEDYFKRSDSDYALLINSKFDRNEYTKHYYWMNVMTFNIIKKISKFIDKNIADILPINEINEEDLIKQLDKVNKLLWDDRDRTNIEKQQRLTYFDGVKEFIGISIGNKTYMKEQIPEKFNLKILKSTSLTDNSTIKYNNKYIDKSEFMKKNKHVPVQRQPFYITVKEESEKYYQALCNIDDTSLNTGIYQYYNETNRFHTPFNNKINYFTLHRLKLNIILYFKTWSKYETNVAYGFFQAPSELIDVPISLYDDYKKNINFNEYINKYENEISNKNLIFNAYSIYGLIDDLCKALFVEQEYPWGDPKYEKKINRLVYFFFIYLNNSYSNWDEIKTKLKEYFNNDFDFSKSKLLFKTYEDKDVNEDALYNKILHFLTDVNERAKLSANANFIGNMNKIRQIFLSNLDVFEPEEIYDDVSESGSESVPYLKKYLKYKQKYLSIKNK